MAYKRHITQEELKSILSYEPETGLFYREWRLDKSNRYNLRWAGKRAGSPNTEGYIQIMIDGAYYSASRLAFLYMTGVLPEHEADHKNRDRSDNIWDNLRDVSDNQQSQNRGLAKNNTSGHKGVSWDARSQKWMAMLQANGTRRYLGLYLTKERAIEVVRKAVIELHGEFASLEVV